MSCIVMCVYKIGPEGIISLEVRPGYASLDKGLRKPNNNIGRTYYVRMIRTQYWYLWY